MSFWSNLLKIGGIVAAPFTGGSSLAATALGSAGQVAGAISGGRAQGRLAESGANNAQYNAQQNAINQAGALDLARKKFLGAAPSKLAGQSLVADLMKNAGDLKLNVPGITTNTTGGVRPSALTSISKDAGQGLADAAWNRMRLLPQGWNSANESHDGSGQPFFGANTTAPVMPQPNALDKILGGVGTFGTIAGSLAPYLKKKPLQSSSVMTE